jgi:hypothetical protein
MATEVEVLGERLLRGFNEEALGNTETVVVAAEAARRVGFDHGSEDYEVALRYLLDSDYLRSASIVGGEGYSITVAGVEKLARE